MEKGQNCRVCSLCPTRLQGYTPVQPQKSKVRSRVEHVFGFMEQTMGGLIFRGVGMIRAKANIALTNLVYNMCRLVQIMKYQPDLIAVQ